MAQDTPFVPIKVKCPLCGAESTHRYLKSRMYASEVVEQDSHVAVYAWENPEFAAIRPNFYHVWHCPACHFCDEKEVFRGEDKCGGKLELIKEKLLVHSRLSDSMIATLGSRINFREDVYPIDSAILAHTLAIYEQELLSRNMRQFPKLARFYLRLAWLYREKEVLGLEDEAVPEGFASFAEYLESFRGVWPGFPIGEEATLETALERYHDVLNHNPSSDVKYGITVMNLILSIHLRGGRRREALQMAKGIFTAATRARLVALNGVKRNIDSIANQNVANFTANAIDKAKETIEELGNQIFKDELPAAKKAVIGMGPVNAQTVVDKLRELKFSDVTCRRMGKIFAMQAAKK